MKPIHLVLIIIVVLSIQSGCKKNDNPVAPNGIPGITFLKTFDSLKIYGSTCAIQTADGGYVMVGGGVLSIVLLKSDPEGNVIWTSKDTNNVGSGWRFVEQTNDKGFIVLGEKPNIGTTKPVLCKTDSTGKKEWIASYPFSTNFRGNECHQTADGGYIIVGIAFPINGGTEKGVLIKTNASGNTEWTKTFGDNSYGCGFYSGQQTIDGGYILCGFNSSFSNSMWLFKTDANGNQSWSHSYGASNESGTANVVRQTLDGGYIISVLSTANHPNDFIGSMVIKTKSDGTQEWKKLFDGRNGERVIRSIQPTSDHGYIITGTAGKSYGSNIIKLWLCKLDQSGNELWSTTYGESNFEGGFSVRQTFDDGYIISGTTTSETGTQSALLLKVDERGCERMIQRTE